MQLSKPYFFAETSRPNYLWKAFQGKIIPGSFAIASFAIASFVSVLLQIQNGSVLIKGKFFFLSYVFLFASFIMIRPAFEKGTRMLLLVLIILSTLISILHYWHGACLTLLGRQSIEERLETPFAFLLSIFLSFQAIQAYSSKEKRVWKYSVFVSVFLIQLIIVALLKTGYLLLVISSLSLLFLIIQPQTGVSTKLPFKPIACFLIPVLIFIGSSFLQAYKPMEVKGPVVNALGYIPTGQVKGLKLHIFNTGFNRMSKTLSPGTPIWRPAPAFVIEHPTKGLVVFDCGLSTEVATNGEKALPFPMGWLFESRGEAGKTLDEQMKKAGLLPEKVSFAILSHFHEDHTGALKSFGNASLVIGGNDKPKQFNQYNIVNKESLPVTNTFLGKSIDLFGDKSLIIMPGGGHSAEDQLLWLNLENGPCLLTGDAVVHFDWLTSSDVERVAVNGERAAEVRNFIRKLMEVHKEVKIFPGHDMPEFDVSRKDIIIENPSNYKLQTWKSVRDDEKQPAELNKRNK